MNIKLLIAVFLLFFAASEPTKTYVANEPWQRAEVIRTAHGVPHIRAEDLRAAGYALAWVQLEDYGTATAMRVLAGSGRYASVAGYDQIGSDFNIRRQRAKAEPKYATLSQEVRDVYEGFAEGVNRFISLHPDEFPKGMPSDFTGFDVLATELVQPSPQKIRNFLEQRPGRTEDDPTTMDEEGMGPDDGSNAWALAPSRTTSGKAILLRNPHLRWTAGYYEAHMTVPGVIDFYGDFRIGGPFGVIGGFNRYLGFSTTNNSQDLDEIYALEADPAKPDHYLFDGRSVPLTREMITVPFRNGESISTETREFWSTELGPVIKRADGKIYVFKYAGDGEIRGGEQFLRMMRARSLDEWKDAMKMRARMTSNFTYADREGNIYYLWNAALPLLPHPPVDDLTAVPAKGRKDVWTEYVPFDALPQVLNPPGGYVRNENSSHHYTNVRTPVVTKNEYPNFEAPRLSLRSQLGIQLIGGDEKFSLEDIVKLKHNYRALLADRVKDDLIAAVIAAKPAGDVAAAVELLKRWDNTTSPESRGSVLFQEWWRHYSGIRDGRGPTLPDEQRYAKVWSVDDPFNTPSGLADPKRAAESFAWAVEQTKKLYGSFDVAWGEVHRVRRGKIDVPVGGCGNDLGCFRIMNYDRDKDGKMAAVGGDCWVLAVEFGDVPRAYSVLAYGQSSRRESPFYADQAEMFARGEMKRVAFSEADIDKQAITRFRPGEKPVR
ncbi:MAG TPA: penicillin acylase family protein [Pyrinomonadaceae bacterium]|nr:penicillin acylase family protein [Pyrinomonadaceae bacterium]HMP66966.1 penicillin acylase family protein [Pyrinomonadaceae bacterium]